MESVEEILQSCRLCLVKEQVNIPIFEESSDLRKISEKINSCLPVKVAKDDNLPKKICDGCSYKLDMVYLFRNTSVDSEKQLIQWLTKAGLTNTIFNSEKDAKTSEILVKQESYDGNEVQNDLGADAHTYIMQQQKLPYQQDFAFPESSAANEEENGPLPKRPKRESAAKKKPPIVESEEEDDDDDDDFDNSMDVPKAEDNYSDEEEDRTDFDAPSTSADAQPGPSGVGTSEAPSLNSKKKRIHLKRNSTDSQRSQSPFDSSYRLRKNQRTPSERLFACDHCPKVFKGILILKKHLKLVHSFSKSKLKLHTCSVCSKDFTTKYSLEIHSQNHNKNYKHICVKCGKGFVTSYQFKKHRNAFHLSLVHHCDFCSRSFKSLAGLKYHKEKSHSKLLKTTFKCSFCPKELSSEYSLKVHEGTHTPSKQICHICGKELKTQTMASHQAIHDNIKPHVCEFCGRGFSKLYNLSEHIRIHTKEKPNKCSVCGRGFAHKTTLNVHMRTHTGERPYKCNLCEKTFVIKYLLNKHKCIRTINKCNTKS